MARIELTIYILVAVATLTIAVTIPLEPIIQLGLAAFGLVALHFALVRQED